MNPSERVERELLGMQPSMPPSGPGSKTRRRWFLGVSGALLVIALVVFRDVLLPFVLAIVLAYVLSPLVNAGEQLRIGGGRVPRWAVVLVMYVALIGLLAGLLSFSVPRLVAEFGRLSKEGPRAVATVRKQWLPELDRRLREATAPYLAPSHVEAERAQQTGQAAPPPPDPTAIEVRARAQGGYEVVMPPGGLRVVPEGDRGFRIEPAGQRDKRRLDLTAAITQAASRAMQNTEHTAFTLLQTAQSLIGKLSRGVMSFVLMLVVSAYLLVTAPRIFEFARSLYAPGRRGDFDEIVRRIDRGLSGVVRGQLIICLVNGALSGIGFYLLGLKYWAFLTIVATVLSIIPIFGAILSTIPAVMIALTQDLRLALFVLAWIIGIHQLEANVLNPKIMGDSARVHPVLVVFALLAGEHVGGLLGALLAVPVLSITQTLFLYLRERFLGVPRGSSFPPPAPQGSMQPAPPGQTQAGDPSRASP
jgi:predicted PurR-regulated permease PerM